MATINMAAISGVHCINFRRSYILIMGRGRARKEGRGGKSSCTPTKRGDRRSYILTTEEVIY